MKNYIIVESSSVSDLQISVSTKMEQGYIPTGGLCVIMKPDGMSKIYFQAMFLVPLK